MDGLMDGLMDGEIMVKSWSNDVDIMAKKWQIND